MEVKENFDAPKKQPLSTEEKINKYLDKAMSLDEKREFETKMKANPELYEKVIEERDVRLIDRLLMHSQINRVINEQENQQNSQED